MNNPLLYKTIEELLLQYPWLEDFFISTGLPFKNNKKENFHSLVEKQKDAFFLKNGLDRKQLLEAFCRYIESIMKWQEEREQEVRTVTLIGGSDKEGNPENRSVTLSCGEVTAIVGPTGSGKSRLLEDIECLAMKDTPTGRQILINHQAPTEDIRFSTDTHLVAQLSQNMNFIMDVSAADFLTLHAESRMIPGITETVDTVIREANKLAGEKFSGNTPVTQLSGGQSRALMIADMAFISASPIILIDEIENAGVDKILALEMLIQKGKIVLISTHDPVLALKAHRRIVIHKGSMAKIIERTPEEKILLEKLILLDHYQTDIRGQIRKGEPAASIPLPDLS